MPRLLDNWFFFLFLKKDDTELMKNALPEHNVIIQFVKLIF